MELETVFYYVEVIVSYKIIQVLLIVIAIWALQMLVNAVLVGLVRRLVPRRKFASKLDEKKREDTLITIFKTGFAVLIWTVGILIVLSQLNVNIAALATGAGLLGIIIGFGAQSTIKDFLAGLFIIVENQYRVGDIVTLNAGGVEVAGQVEDISVRITRLRDLDGNLHIVQNGSAVVVTNLSIGFANVNVDVGVSYTADVDLVEKVINEVGTEMAEDEKWKADILESIQFLRVDSFGESAVNIKALGKVRPAMQWDVAGEFRRRIKKAFQKQGIEIPLPQMVVHQTRK